MIFGFSYKNRVKFRNKVPSFSRSQIETIAGLSGVQERARDTDIFYTTKLCILLLCRVLRCLACLYYISHELLFLISV